MANRHHSSHHGGSHAARHSTSRDRLSLLIAFFLSLALWVLAPLAVARFGILTGRAFLATLDDAYYEYALSDFEDRALYYTLPVNIDPRVLEDVVSIGDMQRDVRGYVYAAFDGHDYEADTAAIAARLRQNVMDELSGAEEAEQAEAIADAYVEDILVIYRGIAKMPGLDAIGKLGARVSGILMVAMGACCSMALALVLVLRSLHHNLHRALRYMAYATGGAALMCLVVPAVLYALGIHRRLSLSPQFFYHFGVLLVQRVLVLLMLAGLLYLLLTVLLVMLTAHKRSQALRGGHLR